ncbi:MAG: hypothetical protein JO307_30305 [Bryobacterales bacterium]|nr:hypothetical protein [Bryobacterales bacterium]
MYQDYKDLLSAFQSHGVKYLGDGSHAVIYPPPRFRKDTDLFVKAATGLKAIISGDNLITSKLTSGRPRDLADVDDIRESSREPAPAPKKPSQASGPDQ